MFKVVGIRICETHSPTALSKSSWNWNSQIAKRAANVPRSDKRAANVPRSDKRAANVPRSDKRAANVPRPN